MAHETPNLSHLGIPDFSYSASLEKPQNTIFQLHNIKPVPNRHE